MAKGYVKIEHDLFKSLYNNRLNASELKVLLFLIRYTKGFQRNIVRASYNYISNGVGCTEETCRKAVKSLCEKGYAEIESPALGARPQVLRILYKNICTLGTRVDGNIVQELLDDKVQGSLDQDIKEEIKDKEIKDKEKASPAFCDDFLPCETSVMREGMSVEDRRRYLELLPASLRERDPDDYTDDEWDIYDEWRVSNGLI